VTTHVQTSATVNAAAAALLVALCACWGLQQVAIKLAGAGITPVLQAGLRSAGALALLCVWSMWRGVPLWRRDDALGPGLVVGLLFAAEFLLLYLGLARTSASRAVLFLYAAPFFVALGAHLFVPGERLRALQVVGLACAFVGLAVAFADGLRLPTAREVVGDVMVLGAAAAWGATTIVVKASRLAAISPNKVLFYQLAVSAPILLALSAGLGEAGVTSAEPVVLAALGYQVVAVAFASYLAWFWLVSRHPAARLAAFTFLTPLFGVAAGAAVLGEPVTPGLVAALLLVCAGIYLVNRPARLGAVSMKASPLVPNPASPSVAHIAAAPPSAVSKGNP